MIFNNKLDLFYSGQVLYYSFSLSLSLPLSLSVTLSHFLSGTKPFLQLYFQQQFVIYKCLQALLRRHDTQNSYTVQWSKLSLSYDYRYAERRSHFTSVYRSKPKTLWPNCTLHRLWSDTTSTSVCCF